MKGYGQFCPIAKASEIFCEKWTPLLLRELIAGSTRFSDLHRGVPLMSPSLLSKRLKQLEEEGIVERRRSASGKSYSYHLTQAGRDLAPIVESLGVWGREWVDRSLDPEDTDVDLLMWDMRRGIDPGTLPDEPVVIRFDFSDQKGAKRQWWLLSEGGEVELCPVDPMREIDIYVETSVYAMIRVWRGDTTLQQALDDETVIMVGSPSLCRAFCKSMRLSPFAHVGSRRAA